jgi:integrase
MHKLTIMPVDGRQNVIAAIEAADLADSTKKKYMSVVGDYLDGGGRLTWVDDPLQLMDDLAAFANTLSHSRRAQFKAAIRLWSEAMIERVKMTPATRPEEVLLKQEAMWRYQGVQKAFKVKARKGAKVHTWLTRAEVSRLVDTARGADIKEQRDRLALALLASAGLRREEAVNLTFEDIKLQPIKGKLRTVLQIAGKGDKNRGVPISDQLAALLDAWAKLTGGRGRVMRSVDKAGNLGDGLNSASMHEIVRAHGREIGKPDLAPHDLRRTYAQIGYESGVPITQIKTLLGHSSVATTQRYLNLDLDLETTISDFVPV